MNPAPVTWLASYPRSGNTLLRLTLKHCFGLLSQSLYLDNDFSNSTLCDLVGHEDVGSDPRHFVRLASDTGRSLYVKTHELPANDTHPAIYVVRDGRSAVVSHVHYLRDVLQRNVTLADVIEGRVGTSWSQHVRAWVMPLRADTLIVRYEDLSQRKSKTLEAISTFIGQPIKREFDGFFGELRRLNPLFFRGGSDQHNIAEMNEEMCQLFERHHGDTMRMLGYSEEPIER